MTQIVIAGAIVVVAGVVGLVLRSRQRTDAPAQVSHVVPTQLDRRDFGDADVPWLVAVFSSATCSTCADVVRKSEVLRSKDVAVRNVEFSADRALHDKYAIAAVPIVVIADHEGTVKAGFTGPVSATDLWAAVAEAREPGTTPEPGLGSVD
jgi:hypothetical protein